MIRHLPALLFGALALGGCGLINAFSEGEVSFDGEGEGSSDCGLDDCFCSGPDCRCDDAEQVCHCDGDCTVLADGGPSCSGACGCVADACACVDDSCVASFGNESCDVANCSCTIDGCFSEG